MKVFDLPNISSNSARVTDFQTLISQAGIPSTVTTKDKFRKWVVDSSTNYHFYSTVEPDNPNARHSESNEIRVIHGIVADYDTKISIKDFETSLQNNCQPDHLPSYYASSFSGGIHAVWEFEQPVNIFNQRHAEQLYKFLIARMRLKKIAPGLDELSISQYFTLCNKYIPTGNKVSASLITTLLHDFMTRDQKVFNKGLAELPFDVIKQEVEKKFPGRWKSNFEEGSRGVRFWDSSANNQNAAIMTAFGMKFFTDGGGFIPWGSSTLLGQAVIEKYRDNVLGNAIKDIYYDGQNYFRQFNNKWLTSNKSDITVKLKVGGLTHKPIDGSASEIDMALEYIHTHNRVAAAMPFLYRKEKVIRKDSEMFVNTNTCFPCTMCEEEDVEIGDPRAAFMWDWMDHCLFPDEYQRQLIYSWTHLGYTGAVEGRPRKGQILYIAGAINVGKTLFNKHVLHRLFGGSYDASAFITGREGFNENLFNVGLGTIDDENAISDQKSHLQYSSIAKKFAANHIFSMRKMYHAPVDIEWPGRLVVTLNKDAESMTLIPHLNMNIQDKMILVQTGDDPIDKIIAMHPGVDIVSQIQKEMPYFARAIYNYKIPAYLKGQNRYGIISYVDSSLASEVDYNSYDQRVIELLSIWASDYFRGRPNNSEWFGNATDLFQALSEFYSESRRIMDGTNLYNFGRRMKAVTSRDIPWIKASAQKGKRGYLITNPEDVDA